MRPGLRGVWGVLFWPDGASDLPHEDQVNVSPRLFWATVLREGVPVPEYEYLWAHLGQAGQGVPRAEWPRKVGRGSRGC